MNSAQTLVMPTFGDNKNVMCYIDAIYVYLRARADDAVPPRPAGEARSEARELPQGRGRVHGMTLRALLAALGAFVFAALPAAGAHAQAPGLGASIELVDPHTLRVCADPRNLPFSNEAGEGFENKIAALLGEKLGRPVAYTYFPQVIGFYRNTLNAFHCDVVMGVAQGDDIVQTTNPYYHTTYALVFKPGHGLDGVTTLEDPRLKDKQLGVVARHAAGHGDGAWTG